MIEAKNLNKNYGALCVLNNVSVQIEPHKITCIVGESGAGKSTLLHVLGTLDKPDSGEIIYSLENDRKKIVGNSKQLSNFRNKHIGFVFQFHQLLPEFTAVENVCIPAWIGQVKKSVAEKKAKELLQLLGLENRFTHKPGQLSGGEQQRVAIARALINDPSIVFADEPTGNLDSKNAEILHQYFIKLKENLNQTFVIVTHNAQMSALGDTVITMKDGKIIE